MFFPILFAIITILLVANINSVYSLKISQYINSFKTPTVEQFYYQEKMLKEAVDSYCRNNFTSCKDPDTNGEVRILQHKILDYTPVTAIENLGAATTPFSDIYLKIDADNITLVHSMSATEKTDYKSHYFNKNANISCVNGSSWPCTDSLVQKKIPISEELQIMYIDVQITALNKALTQPEDYPGAYVDIQNEIDSLNAEKTNLSNVIANRTVKGFLYI
jgi:hypothetical protein